MNGYDIICWFYYAIFLLLLLKYIYFVFLKFFILMGGRVWVSGAMDTETTDRLCPGPRDTERQKETQRKMSFDRQTDRL